MSASPFEFLGPSHIAAMGVTLAVPILLTIAVKRLNSAKVTQAVCGAFAGVLLLNEILPWGQRLALVGAYEFARWYLPLHVCSIAVFAVAAALIFRWQTAYEIAYFWGLAGATNAVVTPQLIADYPAYRFFPVFHCPRRHRRWCAVRNLGPRDETNVQVRHPRLCAAQSPRHRRIRR